MSRASSTGAAHNPKMIMRYENKRLCVINGYDAYHVLKRIGFKFNDTTKEWCASPTDLRQALMVVSHHMDLVLLKINTWELHPLGSQPATTVYKPETQYKPTPAPAVTTPAEAAEKPVYYPATLVKGDKVVFTGANLYRYYHIPEGTIMTILYLYDKAPYLGYCDLGYPTVKGAIKRQEKVQVAELERYVALPTKATPKSEMTGESASGMDGKTSMKTGLIVSTADAERELDMVMKGMKPVFDVNPALKAKLIAILSRMNRIVAGEEQTKGAETLHTIDSPASDFGGYADKSNTIFLNIDNIFKYSDSIQEFIAILRGVNWHEMSHYLFTLDNWHLPEVNAEKLHDYINVLSDCRDETALVSYLDNPVYIKTFFRLTVRRIIIATVEEKGQLDYIGYALLYGRRAYYPWESIQDMRKLCVEKNGEHYTKEVERIVDGYLKCNNIAESVDWARKLKALIPEEAANAASTSDLTKSKGGGGRGAMGRVSSRVEKTLKQTDKDNQKQAKETVERIINETAEIEDKIAFVERLVRDKGEKEAATIIAAMGW